MEQSFGLSDRRSLIAALALLPLAACATPMGRYSVEDAVRRLLQLSSERAFARLTEPGGFYDDQLTRIVPPDLSGGRGGAVLSALLRTNAVRNQVARSLNDVAVDLADNATPIVMDAVQRMTLADAVSVLRGGPTAATDLLAREARGSVVEALLPGASRALRSDMFEMLSAALSASGGRDYAALADNVSGQIGDAIFRAIGREEAEIRRDPGATRDPILMALLR
ncbi:DUF4197 domain-containing protein [Sphingobium sp. AR-3-1]|uniref:DUF4197 domain-containing protein n=1 Tax=Sphingobium psychrophilum TaxID=2728834 RepID=A0A7X9WYI3_9SPHN|nr:DUF4197 domain-containing protein [Sphingobium psychrophilum]NML12271.1 DUF4197 domain-containing protein [Sphingobium psychrophilum]